MSKITDLNRAAVAALRPQIDVALKELGERLGLKFEATSGSYGGNQAYFKLEIKVDDPAVQEAAERAIFVQYCGAFGLRAEDFGTEFRTVGGVYKLIGLNLSRPKYPLKVQKADGSRIAMGHIAVGAIRIATDSKKIAGALDKGDKAGANKAFREIQRTPAPRKAG